MTIMFYIHIWKPLNLYYKSHQIPKYNVSRLFLQLPLLSGVPDYFGRNKISSGGDLSHYSSASLY